MYFQFSGARSEAWGGHKKLFGALSPKFRGLAPKIEVLVECSQWTVHSRNIRSKTSLSNLSGLVSGQEAGVDPLSQQITPRVIPPKSLPQMRDFERKPDMIVHYERLPLTQNRLYLS